MTVDEQVRDLYLQIYRICVDMALYKKKNIIKEVEQLSTVIQEFARAFLNENYYGLNIEDYQLLQQLLMDILRDIVEGMQYQDKILLEDTIEYGLCEFLEILLPDENILMQLKEEAMNGSADI